jgi:hypothetical protein
MNDLAKKSVIVQELASAGLPATQPLTPQALYSALDAKAVIANHQGPPGFDRSVGDQLLKKLQATGTVLTPTSFADVWLEAERKMLDKIAVSQANLDKVNVDQVD